MNGNTTISSPPAMLAIWNGVPADHADDFLAWVTQEHMAERLSLPGFRRGRSFVRESSAGALSCFTLYELDEREACESSDYRTAVTRPSPWTNRVGTIMTDRQRHVLDVISRQGGDGNGIVTVLMTPSREGRRMPDASLHVLHQGVQQRCEGVLGSWLAEGPEGDKLLLFEAADAETAHVVERSAAQMVDDVLSSIGSVDVASFRLVQDLDVSTST